MYTENLRDAWDYAQDADNSSGLTFSTLEDQLTKRVSSNTYHLVYVLLGCIVIIRCVRLTTYLHTCCWAMLYSGWVFWMINCEWIK